MMLQLHEDKNFHYEAIRALAMTRYFGGDVAEILSILPNIKPGDFDDWFNEWHNLALRVLSTIDQSKLGTYSPITLRDVYFRASRYFFTADFFLHGNPSDPRIGQAYELWRVYFDKANALLSIPGQHVNIKTPHGFDMPALVYRSPLATDSQPRPTVIVSGGFDSNMEESLHVFGFPALERGYNVILYEGPGQPTLVHRQKKGFIYDWEKTVTPIVDYIMEHAASDLAFVDTTKLGLIGYSLGGYLSARAAAFEPRLAALMCIDGVWSFAETTYQVFTECKEALAQGTDEQTFNNLFDSGTTPNSSTNRRWFHDHLKYSFCTTSAYDVFQSLEKMTLDGIADRIKCPAFIGEAEEDIFFLGQPARVAEAVGEKATLVKFSTEQAASMHCQSGALVYLNQELWEWFAGAVGDQ